MNAAKSYFLGTVSSIALAGSAAAADLRMPVKAPVVPPPTWAGAYVGLNAGAAWHRWSFNDVDDQLFLLNNAGVNANNVFWSDRRAAFTFGGQIGYNWQVGNGVFGVEGDINWVGARSSLSFTTNNPVPGTVVTAETKLDWFATIRGRLGVTFSPTLIYVTGGVAFVHFRDFYTSSFIQLQAPGTDVVNDRTRATWVAGVGAEHRVSPDWSVKVEALAMGQTVSNTVNQRFGETYRSEFKHSLALLRLGVNRKFPPN
jgi:outer membrane immunogenic protein